jgi:hypothetical protein
MSFPLYYCLYLFDPNILYPARTQNFVCSYGETSNIEVVFIILSSGTCEDHNLISTHHMKLISLSLSLSLNMEEVVLKNYN